MDHDGILNLWQDLQNTLYWYSPLVMAARAGNTATLKALKKRGCKITDSWEGGTTALHIAAEHGHVDACRFLLECGSDRGARMVAGCSNGKGKTALELARDCEGFMEVAELLKTWEPGHAPASDDEDDSDAATHSDEDDD